ncbi:cytochrome c biogenesis CcdA family protein, partial [Thermodesulfobacteriota bacterium]
MMAQDISVYMVFAAGFISFLSPCVLPLVPGYISFISGVSLKEMVQKELMPSRVNKEKGLILLNSLLFVLGFSLVFVLLGASATWVGAFLTSRISLFSKLAGLVIILFGLFNIGLLRPNFFYRESRIHVKERKFGLLGAPLVGAAFAFGWTPCIGPILAGILFYAGTLEKVSHGMALLFIYSMGLGIPFLLTALG